MRNNSLAGRDPVTKRVGPLMTRWFKLFPMLITASTTLDD
jgi:hypothetical protein